MPLYNSYLIRLQWSDEAKQDQQGILQTTQFRLLETRFLRESQ